jgi:hypothetical protein
MKSSAVMAQKEKPKIRESTAHRITDRAGFDESIILNSRDRTCHSRCITKFRRIDSEFGGVWQVYFPARWEPQEYLPHESHLAQVEHILGLIQDAEHLASNVRDEDLKTFLYEEIHLRRIIFYDLLNVVRVIEKEKENDTKEDLIREVMR